MSEQANEAYSAFISYASADREKAQEIAESLEQRGFKCWIAPRDVRGGRAYGDEIIRGIEISRCLVLLLSEAGNESPFVAREVERAVSKRKSVFPVRIENVLPAPSLELFISSTHWIDAWSGNIAPKVEELAALIAEEEEGGKRRPPRALPSKQPWPALLARWPVRAGLAALAVMLAVLGAWSAYRDEAGRQVAEEAAQQAGEMEVAALVPPAPVAPPPPQYKPGDTFRDCYVCPEMVVVPAGTFTMGAPTSEPLWRDSEQPQRQVNITRPFAIGKYEASFDEWDACVADGGCGGYRPSDEGWGRSSHPAVNVSWEDARAYAAWLSQKTGETYRLPTEAQWEYAARAGTTTPCWWGSSISTTQANYDGNYGYGRGDAHSTPTGERRGLTVPVDSFAPNAWGLYQVHGNVWEWVEDCAHENYEGAPTDGSAWTSGGCEGRVMRGGSYEFWPQLARSAARNASEPTHRSKDIGFRVVRTIPQ